MPTAERVLEGVGFSERAHFDCTEHALEVTLRHMGCELEDVLFDEWGFQYVRREGSRALLAVVAGLPIDRRTRFRDHGLRLAYQRGASPTEAVREIAMRLVNGHPSPVWVDSYFLPYYRPKDPRHSEHAVVLVGISDEAESVQIVDPSPWQQHEGLLSMAALAAAMGSKFLREEERNSWAEIDWVGKRPEPTVRKLREILQRNVRAMTSPPGPTPVANGEVRGWLKLGLPGLRQLAEDMGNWPPLSPDDLRKIGTWTRTALSAVARRRYCHARYLISMGSQVGAEPVTQVGEALENLAEAWFLPGNMLFKAGVQGKAELVQRAADRLAGLADKEEALLYRLSAWVDEVT